MIELVRLAIDLLGNLLPFRIVWQWQRGLFFICGRYQWTTGPGLKLIVPYFMDVKPISITPEISTTPLQTITLRDGKTLAYSASITVIVTDPDRAFNRVGHHTETIVELAARILSEGLADADPERFDPARGKRDRLLLEQRDAINEIAIEFGMQVTSLGLNNFVRNVRTFRLLNDPAVLAAGNHLV